MKKKIYQKAFLALLLSGCQVGPKYQTPDLDTPCEWHSDTSKMNTESLNDCVWWKQLEDETLNWLIDQAIDENLDLKIAAIRVLQARREAQGKKADLYPRIDGSANYGHVYYSKDALVNGLLGTAIPVSDYEYNHTKRNVNFYELGFDVEWEIDFFGLTAREIAAAKARSEAVYESLCNVFVTLSAEIAKNYIELRGFQKQVQLQQEIIKIEDGCIVLNQDLLARGLINESDYEQMKATCELQKAKVYDLEIQIQRAIHRLSILVGRNPGDLFDCLSTHGDLPLAPDVIAIGIPSEILRRRPDIRKAERELAAATEKVGSAIAALFPRFSLRGFIGDISTKAGDLFNPASGMWYAGPSLLIPIFNSRLLLEEVKYNKLVTQESIYNYQKVVLEALEESETAIATFNGNFKKQTAYKDAYEYNKGSVTSAGLLYEKGVIDHFALTKAKKNLLHAEAQAVNSEVDLLLSYVTLYKALGGSWEEKESVSCD